MLKNISMPEGKIRAFTGFVIIGLLLAVVFHAAMKKLGFSYPWTTFLFLPGDRFNDWHNSVAAAATHDPYFAKTTAISAYFPFAYLFMRIGAGLTRLQATLLYLGISFSLVLLAVSLSVRYLGEKARSIDPRFANSSVTWKLALACFATYPIIFALDRGNLDIWIACLCAIYIACLRSPLAWLGLLSLALAVALKGYPLAFLGLSVGERRYRDLATIPLAAAALTVAGLASLQGGILHNLQGFITGLAKYREAYVIAGNSLFGSSDPYNALRTIKVFLGTPPSEISTWSAKLLAIYAPLALLISGLAGLCATFMPMPYWRRVTIICLVAIMFPNVANDYKLTILLPAIFTILFEVEEEKETRCSRIVMLLIALLMIPKSYFFINGLSINNLLNAALLLSLAVIAVPIWHKRKKCAIAPS